MAMVHVADFFIIAITVVDRHHMSHNVRVLLRAGQPK